LLVSRTEVVVEVPALESRGQVRPQVLGVGQAIHLPQQQVEGGPVGGVALVEAGHRVVEHVLVAVAGGFGRGPELALRSPEAERLGS
jgi:hypothetical protein